MLSHSKLMLKSRDFKFILLLIFLTFISSCKPGAGGANKLTSISNGPAHLNSGLTSTYAGVTGNNNFSNGIISYSQFNSPRGITFDTYGNAYIADTGNHVIRKISVTGVVTTLAGSVDEFGNGGFVNAIGTAAKFNSPTDVAVDRYLNVYVADSGNNAIRKISSSGQVSTFAGSSLDLIPGFINGIKSSARFANPQGIEVDTNGNIYVADTDNNAIRLIDSETALVSTLAGAVGTGSTDGTTSARFNGPSRIKSDTLGNLFVTDTQNSSIRKIIKATGVVSTYKTGINLPVGIAIDANNNVFVSDPSSNLIRKIAIDLTDSVIAGNTVGLNDGTGVAASFNAPNGIALDPSGNLFVADMYNHDIRKIIISSGLVSTYSGSPNVPGLLNRKIGMAASFVNPNGVAIDSLGNIYISDSERNSIQKISTLGVVTTFAGSLVGLAGYANATGNDALLNHPMGLAFDSSDNLFVADNGNSVIRKISSNGIVSTFAGSLDLITNPDPTPTPGYWNGRAIDAQFNSPIGVAVDSSGSVYVADSNNNAIRKIYLTEIGLEVITIAGISIDGQLPENGENPLTDGSGDVARFNNPTGIAIDSSNNIFVTDKGNNAVRKISISGEVKTIAGDPGVIGNRASSLDQSARFWSLEAVTTDKSGNVYVTDSGNQNIRKITSAGVVTTLAGSDAIDPESGFHDGLGANSTFNHPLGIAIDSGGNLYVADSVNSIIRKIE